MESKSRVTILVKAYPQPSKKHAETVCCAGIDSDGHWRRLFPIRFRQLSGDQAFKRWSIVSFKYSPPTSDSRKESCRVHEESIEILDEITASQTKQNLVDSAILPSENAAAAQGDSLTLIRPRNVLLKWEKKSAAEIKEAKDSFDMQARQATMFDKKLDSLEPCPFTFKMHYEDDDGRHNKTCADWETSAAFFQLSLRYSEKDVLEHLQKTYCEDYVRKGLVFALGTMKRRPQTWQLLGIFPSASTNQLALDI